MSLTQADAEDAYLGARAEFEGWRAQFEAEWYGPLGETLIAATLNTLQPNEYAAIMEALKQDGGFDNGDLSAIQAGPERQLELPGQPSPNPAAGSAPVPA